MSVAKPTREQVEHEIRALRARLAKKESSLRLLNSRPASLLDANEGAADQRLALDGKAAFQPPDLGTANWGEREDMRRESEDFFRAITESLPGAVFSYDLDINNNRSPVYLGPGFAALFGPEAAKHVDGAAVDKFLQLIHPDDFEAMCKAGIFDPSFCEPVEQEYRVRTESGSYKWVRSFARPSRRPNGILRWHGVLIDITDRKNAEDSLRDTQLHLDYVLRKCPTVVYSCGPGPDFPTTFISENISALFGYDVSEFLNDPRYWENRLHPEDAPRILRLLELVHQGRTLSYEYRFRKQDGQYIWVHDQLAPLLDEEGQVTGLTGSWIDISDRKVAEAALRESEEKFRALFEQAAVGVAQIEIKTGRFVQVNSKYCDITGLDKNEMTATTFMAITHPDDLQEDLDNTERLKDGRIRSFTMQKRYLRPDNTVVWVNLTVSPMWKPGEEPTFHIEVVEDITASKRTEEALRESEKRFRAFFEQAAVGVAQIDTKTGRFVKVNRKYCEFIGYSQEEMMATTFMAITYPDDLQDDLDNMERLKRGQIQSFAMKKRLLRPDGTVIWVNLTVSPMWKPGEEPDYHIAVVEDISDSKRMEEELRASREVATRQLAELNDLYDTAPVGLCLMDTDLRYVRINDTLAAINGTTVENHIGRTLQEVIPEVGDTIERIQRTVMETSKPILNIEIKGTTPAQPGVERHWLCSYTPVATEDGQIYGVNTVVSEITSQKKVEAALRRYEHIVSTTSDLMASVDTDYVYHSVNDAYVRAFKVTRSNIIGRSVGELLPNEIYEQVAKPALDRCLSGERVNYQAWFQLPAFGNSYLDVVYTPFRDETGAVSGVTVSARDISQRWQAERERDHLRARLHQSQKLQAVGQLAAGVAHDFNSILMVVLGNTELIRRGGKYEKAASSADKIALDQILDAVERGRGMIQKLLTFGRTRQTRPRLVNLNRVIRQMKTLLTGLVGDATIIEERLCDDLQPINIDAGQIEQVIMNLVLNSRDAMPDGGTLMIETANTDLSETRVGTNADAKPGPHVTICVRDTGHGMSKETMDRMFEPFFTRKPIDKGTGLGLSIVHGIVSQAGGHITVTSSPNRGASFSLHFPVATPD